MRCLSTVQMPSGIPVATVAINGARNAALLAAEIIGVTRLAEVAARLELLKRPRWPRRWRRRSAKLQETDMIDRYSYPEMRPSGTAESRYRKWLEVEILIAEGWAEIGRMPKEAAEALRRNGDKLLEPASTSASVVQRILELEGDVPGFEPKPGQPVIRHDSDRLPHRGFRAPGRGEGLPALRRDLL